ncbi:MAG: hypothetical protein IPK33_08630 [Gemmatimonadetes bacterium]|nr:hypothetical protein [Gemmatimonadota bacterium]
MKRKRFTEAQIVAILGDGALGDALRENAAERPRWGYRRPHVLLARAIISAWQDAYMTVRPLGSQQHLSPHEFSRAFTRYPQHPTHSSWYSRFRDGTS